MQTTGNYNENNSIKLDTKVIQPNLCDYSTAYILVTANVQNKPANSKVCLKNCAPFVSCTSQINDEFLEEAKNFDIVMPMYNLLEYSDNYEDSTGSLFHFKRSEVDGNNAGAAPGVAINPNSNIDAVNSKPFDYRASLAGDAVSGVQIAVPLKYLSNFFRSSLMPLIICKIHLELTWSSSCLLRNAAAAVSNSVNVTFAIANTKLYFPILTLSTKDTNYLKNELTEGFKRSVYWNKYVAKIETLNSDNNSFTRIKLDPSFQGVKRLFVLVFNRTAGNDEVQRDSSRKHYLPRVNITEYNVLIMVEIFTINQLIA